jgi:Triosephosphate isomerase
MKTYQYTPVILGFLLSRQTTAFFSKLMGRQKETTIINESLRKPFITGNWKLNPSTKDEAIELANSVAKAVSSTSPADVAVFVPFPFLESVQNAVGDKMIVGAQVRNYHFKVDKISLEAAKSIIKFYFGERNTKW